MNTDRILTLARAIDNNVAVYEGQLVDFNMDEWITPMEDVEGRRAPKCGTAACIGGHAEILFNPSNIGGFVDNAAELLGLDHDTADALFFPVYYKRRWDRITRAKAARVLRHLAKTGNVDWSV